MGPFGFGSFAELKQFVQIGPDSLGADNTDESAPDDLDVSSSEQVSTEWDAILAIAQKRAKARIVEYVGRDFTPIEGEQFTTHLYGDEKTVRLPGPISSIDNVTAGPDSRPLESGAYALEGDTLVSLSGPFPRGELSLTYSGGYERVPTPIIEAESMLVENRLTRLAQQRGAPIVQAEDYALELRMSSALTGEIRGMLEGYTLTEFSA